MKKIFIVGPLISQHIQCWYANSEDIDSDDLSLFTIHKGGSKLHKKIKEYSFSFFNNKIDFLVFLPFFILLWWLIRPKVTNFHFLSSYGLMSLFIPKKNLILNTWGSDVNLVYASNNRFKKYIVKLALRRFAWINTPAEHMKTKLIALGADPDKIEVFQYGIEIDNQDVYKKIKKENEKVIFVSNRNWQDLYNIQYIVSGFAEYKSKNNTNTFLHVYGRGSKVEEDVIRSCLKKYNKEVLSSIIFMGYTAKKDMLEKMVTSDVYVSIPSRDGAPLSLLEAMALGLYPIVSSIDANHEWILHNNGLFIQEASNVKEIAQAIKKSVDIIFSNNRNYVKNNYNIVKNKANISANVPRFHQKINYFLTN